LGNNEGKVQKSAKQMTYWTSGGDQVPMTIMPMQQRRFGLRSEETKLGIGW
jgi:hypothetical protein